MIGSLVSLHDRFEPGLAEFGDSGRFGERFHE
jgi:hypothetical protein